MENELIKILYIDDEIAALFNFEQLFQDDFEVFTAASAAQGINILTTTEIQIVISDQRMPNKTGIEFLTEVAQLYPDTVRILLTAYSQAEVIIDAINQGQVYQYITKPFETKNLKNILDKASQNWRLKRENQLLITQLQKKNADYEVINEELRQTNQELCTSNKIIEESKKQTERILETAIDGFWMVDMKGQLIDANEAYCQMSGYTREELLTLKVSDLEAIESDDDVKERIKKVITVGEDRFETQHRTKSGKVYDVEISLKFQANDNGCFVLFIRDITEEKKAEKALLESETQFRNLANSSSTLIWTSGTDKLCNYFNETWLKFTGRTLEQEMGNGWAEGVHPEDFDRCLATYVNAFDKQEAFEMEYRLLHVSGEYKWILDMGTPNFNSNNEFVGYIGNCYDITERKKAEKILAESERRFRELLSTLEMISVVLDIDGTIIFCNNYLIEITGWQKEEVIGKNWFKVFLPSYVYSDVNQVFTEAVNNGNIQTHYENAILTKNGNEILVSWNNTALYDEHGNINSIASLGVDITANKIAEKALIESEERLQKALEVSNQSRITLLSVLEDQLKAKETLRESEEKLSTLFGSMTEMVVMHELVFNENGEAVNYVITDCNKAFTEITGIKNVEAIGKLATEVYETKTVPYLKEYAEVCATGKSIEFNSFFAPMDKHFLISVVSSGNNRFSTISADITTNEQIHEIIKEKNKELENYIYVASHDLRSPLVNIQGFSQRLQKQIAQVSKAISNLDVNKEMVAEFTKITSVEISKSLHFILSNVSKMDTLINGLLQLSRTGQIKMNVNELDMTKLMNEVLAIYNYQLTELKVQVKIHDLSDCYGDENQLNQLFSNIIGNALKYRDKSRKLTLEIASVNQHNKVIYSIKDNGIGIKKRHLEKIWDVFYRVDASANEAGEGLGLSLVKRIVEKHKGKIWAESTEGEGSIFYVELHKNNFEE